VLRFSLLDEPNRFVIGYPELHGDSVRRAIEVGGRTVGWLVMAPFQTVSAAADVRFERNQIRASFTIGTISMLLAAVIALWVARRLLRPVKKVAEATHRIAAGEYASRVEVSSSDEVGQLARDFNTMADTLQRNEQMRRDFMADVSHELRTPLGVLHGELEAMEDGVHTLGPASVKSLQAEVATMNKLVSDLYDLSLADVGALAYRKLDVDAADVLAATADVFGARFAERGITLETRLPAAPLMVHADERRLQQLFNNLMENSVRYTDGGGCLQVEARREGGSVLIDLRDSAPGVRADRLARLFDRFYRVEASRSRASGGAGLGLAICQSIVKAHEGTIEARPSPLGGLWLAITLPAVD
jgi:two-component system sensor histidine kinase BaeS